MTTASTPTTVLFILLSLVMAGVGVAFLRRSGALPVAAFLAAYLVVPAVLAASGRLDRYLPPPAPGLVLILVLTLGTVAAAFSRLGGRVAAEVPVALLVGFQGFRVAVELLLHRLHVEGVIPVQMTYAGRNFDIVAGATGLLLGLWLRGRERPPRGVLLGWNVLGLLLLTNIVVIAVLATPMFGRFPGGPPNILPSRFPFVWLPSVLVQMALFGHLVLFRRLRRPAT